MNWLGRLFGRKSPKKPERLWLDLPSFAPKSVGGVLIAQWGIKCPDGAVISLSEIVDVNAPTFLIAVDPHLAEGEISAGISRGGVVMISIGRGSAGHPPRQVLIPTSSMEEAQAIVNGIQEARKVAKQCEHAAEQGRERPTVGTCPKCGKTLHVRPRAIKREMHLTCGCGEKTLITLSKRDLRRIEEEYWG